AGPLVSRETLRHKLPKLVTATAPARAEISVLAKKRIALDLGCADLLDDNIAVVHQHALLSPVVCCASESVTAHLACVEEIFGAAPRMVKELFSERPSFAAGLAFPPGQVCFMCVQFRTSSSEDSQAGFSLVSTPDPLGDALPSPVGSALHVFPF